ncbi:MAG: ABC transporter ATP-binding protein, partial [Anaerolineae bacterium]|nr:ABC transporter ATP-binding protein [Anaerolineae bacterium]
CLWDLCTSLVNEVFALIAEIKSQGIPILLVEQNARKALQIADYVYVLDRGQIVNEGSAQEIQQDTDILSAYLG